MKQCGIADSMVLILEYQAFPLIIRDIKDVSIPFVKDLRETAVAGDSRACVIQNASPEVDYACVFLYKTFNSYSLCCRETVHSCL